MNFSSPLFIKFGLIAVITLILGFVKSKFPPKKINHLYGYRTSLSMKSQEAWDFSQLYSANFMINIGLFLIIPTLFFLFFEIYPSPPDIIMVAFFLVPMILLIIKTERALKQKFPKK